MSVLALLALATIQPSNSAAAVQSADERPIIVTGQRIDATARALAECLARNCPPEEDIDATLAHAENLFVGGDYATARTTLRRSLGRNARHAKAHPVPVSDLYRATSRVAAHLGEGRDFERNAWGIKRALSAGLPDDDPRVIGAELEVAGMQASLRMFDRARASYANVARRAERIGRRDLAAIARLRLAGLNVQAGHSNARKRIEEIAEDRDPATRFARLSALFMLSRLDRDSGGDGDPERLIAALREAGLDKPTLLYAPPIEFHTSIPDGQTIGSTTRLMATDNFDDRWMDVGFQVQTDGRVADIEVLRSKGETHWAKPVLTSIAGRQYSPAASVGGGVYRVERYTYTSLWRNDVTGTRIRQRSANARVEMLDLTTP